MRRILAQLAIAALAAVALAGVTYGPIPVGAVAAAGAGCTVTQGQALIDEGRYQQAVRTFSCIISAAPTEAHGYRGRAEAELLLGRYADAFRDYTRITAFVEPLQPAALTTIHADYGDRLAVAPSDVPALTGASFARWYDFDYAQAAQLLTGLLAVRPDDPYATLFLGSSRLLLGGPKSRAVADLARAIELAPSSPDVRFIVADAYTYGLPDPVRAFEEASLALDWGLDTPRVHAILGASHNAFGDVGAAATHIARHIELATAELISTDPLPVGGSLALALVPGRTYQVPVLATAGASISVDTGSKDYWDSIAVLLDPDGLPVVGSDDDSGYFAAIDWVAPETGTYRLQVTFFEAVNTGVLHVGRS
jgi:tetratricopeptide (TPR) repeat protein